MSAVIETDQWSGFLYRDDNNAVYFCPSPYVSGGYTYIIYDDIVEVYVKDKIIPYPIEKHLFKEILDYCVKKEITIVETPKPKELGYYSVGDFLRDANIRQIHFRYASARILETDRNRKIIARLIAPYSGVLIVEQHNGKNLYSAYKYVINNEKTMSATFVKIPLKLGLDVIKKFKDKRMQGDLTPEIEQDILSAAFMEKL